MNGMRSAADLPDDVDELKRLVLAAEAGLVVKTLEAEKLRFELARLKRMAFIARYTQPYFKELYARKPCTLFASLAPLTVELHTGIEELTSVLTSGDQRYLTDGFVLTEHRQFDAESDYRPLEDAFGLDEQGLLEADGALDGCRGRGPWAAAPG
ncbi:MAG: hypothetical protein HC783_15710 [Rhodobacteraceae bacterium]|nr:hypothetical protein [Paracoccaceae bacterium]